MMTVMELTTNIQRTQKGDDGKETVNLPFSFVTTKMAGCLLAGCYTRQNCGAVHMRTRRVGLSAAKQSGWLHTPSNSM